MKRFFLLLLIIAIVVAIIIIATRKSIDEKKSEILNVFLKNEAPEHKKHMATMLDLMSNNEINDVYILMSHTYYNKKSKLPQDFIKRIELISKKYNIFT